MKIFRMTCCVAVTALLGLALQLSASPSENRSGNERSVDVMTVNLYIGGDPFEVLALDPSDPAYQSNLVAAVTTIFYEIMASQPDVRLQGIADEIAARQPDIVTVQEASLIRIQSPGDLSVGGTVWPTNVVVDYLGILVSALQARGVDYAVASAVEDLDIEMPMMNLQTGVIDDIRLTDRDAILVRTDKAPGQLNVKNPQSGNFSVALPLPDIDLTVPRGWCSVDLFVRGKRLRVICAHTETQIAPAVQTAQISELLSGPADVDIPVIIAGDFNTDPLQRDGSTAYGLFTNAGFLDSWNTLYPSDTGGGLTWGHDKYLTDPYTDFIWRLDLIMYRGDDITPTDMSVIDIELDRTADPLWASDHAAVCTHFSLSMKPRKP
jgi:hypothetical protein